MSAFDPKRTLVPKEKGVRNRPHLAGTVRRRIEFYPKVGGAMEAPMKQEIAVIFLLWFALQVPLAIFIGKCIDFGMKRETPSSELEVRQDLI